MKCEIAFKDWELGAECFETMDIFTLATYTRFRLLKKLSRNCLAFLKVRFFSMKFLNGFMSDASRAPPSPTKMLLHGLAGGIYDWQCYTSVMLYWFEARPHWPLSFSDSPISPTYLHLHLFLLPLHTVSYFCTQAEGGEMDLKSRCSPYGLCGSLDTFSSIEVFLISWLWLFRMYED